jgi:ankyrin repeat protein
LWSVIKKLQANDIQLAVSKQSRYGWSPLLVAAEQGHTDMVKLLLENNARSDVFEEVYERINYYFETIFNYTLNLRTENLHYT